MDPARENLGVILGVFKRGRCVFVAICGSGQPFSWTGVGVRWIKAGIFTIDVAQIWQDFQQSPTLRLLGIWHNLGNIKVSLSLHTSPKKLYHTLTDYSRDFFVDALQEKVLPNHISYKWHPGDGSSTRWWGKKWPPLTFPFGHKQTAATHRQCQQISNQTPTKQSYFEEEKIIPLLAWIRTYNVEYEYMKLTLQCTL